MDPRRTIATQRQIWAEVSGYSGSWGTVGVLRKGRTITKVRNGGAPNEQSLAGPASYQALNLSRFYALGRDPVEERRLEDEMDLDIIRTITIFRADRDRVVHDRRTYLAMLEDLALPEGDAMSGSPAVLATVWSIEDGA